MMWGSDPVTMYDIVVLRFKFVMNFVVALARNDNKHKINARNDIIAERNIENGGSVLYW